MTKNLGRHDRDYLTGKSRRDLVSSLANRYFAVEGIPTQFRPLHGHVHLKSVKEKGEDCVERNFTRENVGEKGMALHYLMEDMRSGRSVPFVFMPWESFGAHMKLPSNALGNPDEYLYRLDKNGYYVLVVKTKGEIEPKFSDPIAMNIVRSWPHRLAESKKNKNRLLFQIDIKKIYCRKFTEKLEGLFQHTSVLEELILLLSK